MANVVVITDGFVRFPDAPMPYDLLWVLLDSFAGPYFDPPYGSPVVVTQ